MPRPRSARVEIRGKRWSVRLGRVRPDWDAECDLERRRIVVRPSLGPEERLGCVIHEVVHAALPDLDEEAVLGVEAAIMGAIEAVRKKGWLA
jgi:hypothetical protein